MSLATLPPAVPAGSAAPTGTAARILDAAAHLLARHGYGGLRIQQVARAAGVRPAAIYYYFDSREALVEEVLWSGMARLRRHVEDTLATLPPETTAEDRLLRAVEEQLRHVLGISDYTQASIRNAGQVPAEIRERQRREFRAYRELWLGLAGEDRRLELMVTIGALSWTVEWWRPDRGDLTLLIDQARTLARHGLLGTDTTAVPVAATAPPALRPVDTRDRIMAAAAATLRARGYAKTHLAEIAERADVQAPAIYHYFRSRDALITTVLTQGQRTVRQHMDAALEALPAGAGPRERAAALTAAYLRVELELSDFATALTRNAGQVPPRMREALAAEGALLSSVWQSVLVEAQEAGQLRPGLDPTAARMLVLGALNWVPEWWHSGLPVDDVVAAAVRVVCGGLFTPVPSPAHACPGELP
ncbi:MAG TPA: TetR family transcriptional regulator [Nocardioides sp.]|nr:TetR family transcriptional regulator [Nocardioides sp.]